MTPNLFSRPDITRRAFLLGSGAVLLAACGSSKNSGDGAAGEAGTGSSTGDGSGSGDGMHEHDQEFVPGVLSSDLYVSDQPQRIAFTVLRNDNGEPSAGKPARIAIAPPGAKPTDYVDGVPRFRGLPEFRGVYSVAATLAVAGPWTAVLDYDGSSTPFAFQVNPKPAMPAPGSAAPTAASPTTTATLGVDPICTSDPVCPLHTRSLDELIGKGRPVAVLFATPARCQSAYCGPVLDTMLPVVADYPGIDFVHVDIYRNARSQDLAPTVEAWGLLSEPWLFTIDPQGKVRGRLDGAFDETEMRELFDAIA